MGEKQPARLGGPAERMKPDDESLSKLREWRNPSYGQPPRAREEAHQPRASHAGKKARAEFQRLALEAIHAAAEAENAP
jgi:hypothetical protein